VTTELPATSTRCRIDLEGWDGETAARVWSDSRHPTLRDVLVELGELLAQHVDDPNTVSLIVPMDMKEAVRRRDPEVPYTIERGSGVVGARTMSLPVGCIDVIINPAGPVAVASGEQINRELLSLLRRGLVHEAQHVIMGQRGSGYDEYGCEAVEGPVRRQFVMCAAQVCDEHRAEWQAIQLAEPEPPTISDVNAVLEALGRQVAAANQIYQAAPGPQAVRDLAGAVFTACAVFWTALGYWTAQHRTDDANIADIPAEIAALPLWQRYVGDTWSRLQGSLRTLPVENLTTSRETLHAAAQRVADTLTSSLETIGFRGEDGEEGWAFYITRFDFPAEQ
jgi:hypothetical protein